MGRFWLIGLSDPTFDKHGHGMLHSVKNLPSSFPGGFYGK